MQLCTEWMEANLEYVFVETAHPGSYEKLPEGTGKRFKEFDYPIEETGPIKCTIVIQQPVITVNVLVQ